LGLILSPKLLYLGHIIRIAYRANIIRQSIKPHIHHLTLITRNRYSSREILTRTRDRNILHFGDEVAQFIVFMRR
jgi:hypothetical protein